MAGKQLFSNNASTTLAGSISPSSTTVTLATGTGALFPNPTAPDYFMMSFTDSGGTLHEIVKVTARSGDVITMTRAQEGTTGQSWASGTLAGDVLTAGTAGLFAQAADTQLQAGNWCLTDSGSANAIIVTPSVLPTSFAGMTGMPLRILKSAAANTAAVTIKVSLISGDTGAIALKHADGTDLLSGELPASGVFSCISNGTVFVLQSVANTATALPVNSVPNSKLAQMAANTVKSNLTGGTANAADNTLAAIIAGLFPLVTKNNASWSPGVSDAGSQARFISTGAGTNTLTLPSASVVGANWFLDLLVASADADYITINLTGGQTLDGFTSQVAGDGTSVRIVSDGSNFVTTRGQYASRSAYTTVSAIAGATLTFTHNLGRDPKLTKTIMNWKCISADQGWSVGDTMNWVSSQPDNANRMPSIFNRDAGSSVCNVSMLRFEGGLNVVNLSTGLNQTMDNTKWAAQLVTSVQIG